MLFIKTLIISASLFVGPNSEVIKKAKKDFAEINHVFEAPKLSVEMTYNFYEQHVNASLYESYSGKFFKNGTSDYSMMMNVETLHTPELTITAQSEDKILIVSDAVKGLSKPSVSVDSLLRFCKDIKYSDLGGDGKYELYFNQSGSIEFKKVEMIYELNTYRLKKLVLYFWQQDKVREDGEVVKINPKVEINYSNYDKVDVSKMKVFDSSSYVSSVSANKYKCTGKYSGYTIYNQKLK